MNRCEDSANKLRSLFAGRTPDVKLRGLTSQSFSPHKQIDESSKTPIYSDESPSWLFDQASKRDQMEGNYIDENREKTPKVHYIETEIPQSPNFRCAVGESRPIFDNTVAKKKKPSPNDFMLLKVLGKGSYGMLNAWYGHVA